METDSQPLGFCISNARPTVKTGLGCFVFTRGKGCGQRKLKYGFGGCSIGRKASKRNLGHSSHLTVGITDGYTAIQMAIPEQVIQTPSKFRRNKKFLFRV